MGKSILFNIKDEDKIIAQGFMKKDANGNWLMSQLRYAGNDNAEKDFESDNIMELIKQLIKKDKILTERYLL